MAAFLKTVNFVVDYFASHCIICTNHRCWNVSGKPYGMLMNSICRMWNYDPSASQEGRMCTEHSEGNMMKKQAFMFFKPGIMTVLMVLLAIGLSAYGAPPEGKAAAIPVKSGDKMAFMGDSITAGGAGVDGYITLVIDAFKKEGLDVISIPAGKSGHKSNDMLGRLDNDVISKSPQWMLLSCGVNDVWHFQLRLGKNTFTGVPLEDYKKNITAIIEKAQSANIKVMILTSTMIGEDPERELNKNMIPYNDFLRQIAKEKKCLLADLNVDMQEAIKKIPDEKGPAKMFGERGYKRDIKNKLTSDGCHMNKLGNIMMAKGILKAFGLSEDKIATAEKSWLTDAPPKK